MNPNIIIQKPHKRLVIRGRYKKFVFKMNNPTCEKPDQELLERLDILLSTPPGPTANQSKIEFSRCIITKPWRKQ